MSKYKVEEGRIIRVDENTINHLKYHVLYRKRKSKHINRFEYVMILKEAKRFGSKNFSVHVSDRETQNVGVPVLPSIVTGTGEEPHVSIHNQLRIIDNAVKNFIEMMNKDLTKAVKQFNIDMDITDGKWDIMNNS